MQHRGAQKGNGLPQSKRGKLGGSAGTKVSVLWLAFQERVLAFSVAPGRSWKRAAFRGERWLKCFPCPADVTALPGNDLWFYFFSTLHQIAFHLYFSCCISVGPSVVERDGRRSIDGLKRRCCPSCLRLSSHSGFESLWNQEWNCPWQKASGPSARTQRGWRPLVEIQGQRVGRLPQSRGGYANKSVPG